MNTLKRGFIILVAGLFLVVVSIGGALAADKRKLPETQPGIKTTDPSIKDTTKRVKRHTKLHKVTDDERTKPVKKDNQEGIAVIKNRLTD